jgi:hypothetical protein
MSGARMDHAHAFSATILTDSESNPTYKSFGPVAVLRVANGGAVAW